MAKSLERQRRAQTPTCATSPSHRAGAGAALIPATAVAACTADAHDVLYLDEGRVYRGEVLDGRPHGEGEMIWPSGAVYTGTWVDGARHGTGTYRESNGVTYVGEFRDGAMGSDTPARRPRHRRHPGARDGRRGRSDRDGDGARSDATAGNDAATTAR